MQVLVQTLLHWPQGRHRSGLTALAAALAFALSPLMLLWGRIAVSDALFTGCLAISLLLCWSSYAAGGRHWWSGWLLLGLAVLAKGPLAVVLLGLTLVAFGWLQADFAGLRRSLKPVPGLLLAAAVALPWYAAALLREGEPFWRSFFGYHNLQRFSTVVNNHQAPWWFFLLLLVLASLPFSPLLLVGLVQGIRGPACAPALSLQRFAACWLLAVLLFFTAAATKLPSYWLPATPAAGVLIALAAQRGARLAWWLVLGLTLVLALGFGLGPVWVPWIVTPEMPTLPAELLASGRLVVAAGCFLLAALLGLLGWRRGRTRALVLLQLPLVLFVPLALLPLAALGDRLRAEPVRQLAARVGRENGASSAASPVAMVGMLKPSLHFYGRQVVIYEEAGPVGLLNLEERLAEERRKGQNPSPAQGGPPLLLVIDSETARLPHWQGLASEPLERSGIYALWRVDRVRLVQRAEALRRQGLRSNWREFRPERY
jgi:4-amino-4-deoxy-L-arabinose transferase-like glycosyltransferase